LTRAWTRSSKDCTSEAAVTRVSILWAMSTITRGRFRHPKCCGQRTPILPENEDLKACTETHTSTGVSIRLLNLTTHTNFASPGYTFSTTNGFCISRYQEGVGIFQGGHYLMEQRLWSPSNWGTRSYATYIHKHQSRCCFDSTIGIVMKGSCRLLLCSLGSYILRHYDTVA